MLGEKVFEYSVISPELSSGTDVRRKAVVAGLVANSTDELGSRSLTDIEDTANKGSLILNQINARSCFGVVFSTLRPVVPALAVSNELSVP